MNQRHEAGVVREDVHATAADWWVKQDRGALSELESVEFEKWLADPHHARAYRRVRKACETMDGAQADPTIAALRQAALEIPRAPRWVRTGIVAGTLAAACAAVAIGVLWFRPAAAPSAPVAAADIRTGTYRTHVGEQQTVTLSDGSRVTLDTLSALDVSFSPSTRLVNLHAGRARFEVAHDARPFVVQAGSHRARALGTAFDVRLNGEDLDILLVEGSLLVEPLSSGAVRRRATPEAAAVTLAPGQRFSTAAGRPRVTSAEVKRETLWLDGFVEFDDQRLDLAVAEINRYAVTPIRIRNPAVASMRISGIFHTRQSQRFLEVVQGLLPVEVRRQADQSAEIVPKGNH
jgi:transmembrane sensor